MKTFKTLLTKYPIIQPIILNALIYPTGSILEQTIKGTSWKNYNWKQACRYSFYGAVWITPAFYYWNKITEKIWIKNNLTNAIKKAILTQIFYGPLAIFSFFFGMNLLEGKPIKYCLNEAIDKGPTTFMVGACVWPILQTINFSIVPSRYRAVYLGVCTVGWTCFLAHKQTLPSKEK